MDWPSRLVIERSGKSYIKLFEPDADDTLKILQEHWNMDPEDHIIIREEDGQAIFCRKSYLYHINGYFRSFVGRWNQKGADSTAEVKLNSMSIKVFKNLLELASTGLLKMGDHSDLFSLVSAANFLQTPTLSSRFLELIREEMNLNNSLMILWGYLAHEESHGYIGLREESFTFTKARFDTILATCAEQLLEMSSKQWLDIISDPALFVVSEDLLLKTLCHWVAADPVERAADFEAIGKHIRVGCLSKNLLEEFCSGVGVLPAIRDFANCVMDAAESHPRTIEIVASLSGSDGAMFSDPLARFQGALCVNDSVAIGKLWEESRGSSSSTMMFLFRLRTLDLVNPIRDIWSQKAEMPPYFAKQRGQPFHIEELAAAYLDGFIYMAVWEDETLWFYKIEVADPTFSQISKLHVPGSIQDEYFDFLVGYEGKLHMFTQGHHHIYEPSSATWSSTVNTHPFPSEPKNGCVGPDGMIYIQVEGESCLWIYNLITSDTHTSGACPDALWKVMTVENKIVCTTNPKSSAAIATRIYDCVGDLWREPRETEFGTPGRYWFDLPVRILTHPLELFRAGTPMELNGSQEVFGVENGNKQEDAVSSSVVDGHQENGQAANTTAVETNPEPAVVEGTVENAATNGGTAKRQTDEPETASKKARVEDEGVVQDAKKVEDGQTEVVKGTAGEAIQIDQEAVVDQGTAV